TGSTSDYGNSMDLILKTDSLGNQEWVNFYGNGAFHNPGFSDIIATHDSCYVVCGAYTYGETFGGLYPYDGWLVKIDNDGNEIWNKKYRDYTVENTDWRDTIYNVFNGVTELSNGNLALIATSKNGQLYGRKPKFYLLNSVGDSILTKIYETANPWYNPNTIITTNDNGFAIGGSGEFYDWDEINQVWVSSQRIFLIKTDSLGNDTILSDISPVQSKPITEFKLQCYPNPATDEFFVELPQWIEDDVLEIYSTNGSLVLLQTVGVGINKVDICDLQPGMYLARLKNTGMAAKLIVQ
ncbi:MAG: T9SS type A sorting domain-containing protein, partial [Bacteroidales bacterium]|nr:T9SS type A sorting domain-containing protein [Bacteroidales bacterium]